MAERCWVYLGLTQFIHQEGAALVDVLGRSVGQGGRKNLGSWVTCDILDFCKVLWNWRYFP